MEPFLSAEAFSLLLSQAALILIWLAAGLLFYGWLTDQIVLEGRGLVTPSRLGPVDVAVAATLTLLMLTGVVAWIRAPDPAAISPEKTATAADIISGLLLNSLISFLIIGGVLASLTARNIRWREIFGFDRVSPGGVFGRGAVLIGLTLPVIYGAGALWWVVLAANRYLDNTPQELVRFLSTTSSVSVRVMITVSAVVLAPVQEELIFRGYLYGTVRRYAGAPTGIVLNSALFALIHLHTPSLGALFVLGVCLTLAYEWTGSIFVSMVMHALFNATTVVSLLHGNQP